MVGLDPGQHFGLGRVGIDLGRDRDPGRLLLGQLRLADLQDGVRRQAVEGAQRDQLVIGFGAQGEGIALGIDGRRQPRLVGHQGVAGAGDGRPKAALPGVAIRPCPSGRGGDLVEEARQLARGLQLERVPASDSLAAQDVRLLGQHARRLLEAAGDRLQSVGERCEVAREEREEAIADLVDRGRATLPRPQVGGREEILARLPERDVALERRRRGEPHRVEGLERGDIRPRLGDVLLGRVSRDVPQAVVVVMAAEEGGGHGSTGDEGLESRSGERLEVGVERSGRKVGHGLSWSGDGLSSVAALERGLDEV